MLIIAVLAFLVPLVTTQIKVIRIPVVVGEIIVGIVIGNSGLGLVHSDPWLEFLATLGFTYLMFISGLEIDFGLILQNVKENKEGAPESRSKRANAGSQPGESISLWTALYIFVGTLVGSFAASFGLAAAGLVRSPWIMGLILSTTSVGIVVPILKERGLTSTPFGQGVILASLLADFGTMVLITAAAALIAGGSVAEVLLVLFLFVAFFVFHRLGVRFTRGKIVKELAHATAQIDVRGSFMLIFIFVALAERLGSEVILGAFLAGTIVSLLSDRAGTNLRFKLDAIGFGFFIPVFFIMVGVRFDAAALVGSGHLLLLIPTLLVVLYAVKIVPSLMWVPTFGWRKTVAGGLLIASRLSLLIAAADIGMRLGVISESINAAIILLAIVTSSLSPILFARFAPVPEVVGDRCLIVGANRMGMVLAQRLKNHRWEVVVIDADPQRADDALGAGVEVTRGDARDPDVLLRAGEGCRAIVTLIGNDEVNAAVAETAKEVHPAANVVAIASDPTVAEGLTAGGIRSITPALSTLVVLENLVRHPDLVGLLSEDSEKVRVEDVFLTNPRYAGVNVRELPLPDGVLAISLYRDGQRLVPRGTTVTGSGDRLTLVGPPDAVQVAVERIGFKVIGPT